MIAENYRIVPLLTSADIGATTDLDSIDITQAHKVTVIFTCGAFTGNGTFSFASGATNGAKTTAVPFKIALGSAAIGATTADVLADWTDVTTTQALTCTTKMVVAEIDCQAIANSAHKFLTGTVAATAGVLHASAIVETRYGKNQNTTII